MNPLQELENSIISISQLKDDGCPTASIAILENGEISAHVITAGKENKDTAYQACSISKAITGLAIARLIDLGMLSYESKVIDFLPQSITDNFPTSTNRHLLEEVTIAMLLSHTSGLSQGGFPGFTGNLPTTADIVAGRAPSRTPKIVFNGLPGTQLQYSGGGFLLLQVAMETVMKMSFPHIMQDIVLKPLGMTRSWYTDIPPGETNYAKAHFNGHTPTDAPYHHLVESAAAGLWTTPTDLLKAAAAIQHSMHNDGGFLTRKTAERMLRHAGSSEEMGAYGMGWAVNDGYFAHSGGNDPGYTSYLLGSRGEKSDLTSSAGFHGVAVTINTHYFNFKKAIPPIVSAIFFLKGWTRYEELPSTFGRDDFAPYAAPEGTEVRGDWRGWLGKWEQDLEIIDRNGPTLAFNSHMSLALKPAAAPVGVALTDKSELVFVVDGMKMGLRLTWQGEEQVIELLTPVPRTVKRSGK